MARKAVVTGASSGIGAATSALLQERGFHVVGVSRRPQPDSADGTHFPCDLADLDALPRHLERLVAAHGDAEVVVLNAGQGRFGALEQMSYRQIREQIDLNLVAAAFLARALLPELKRRRRGHLIFVGSESALVARRSGSIYCASKFGLRGLALALRDECARAGVRVTSVHPGMVRTPFFDDLDFEPGAAPGEAIAPEDVAAAVLHAIEAPAGTVLDEIVLSPLKHVVRKKPMTPQGT